MDSKEHGQQETGGKRQEGNNSGVIDFRAPKGKQSDVTADQRVALYVERHRVPIVTVAALIVAALIGYTAVAIVSSKAVAANLAKIDAISKAMTTDASSLDDAALKARRLTAMEALKPLVKKGGAAGVRANMLAAEIAWQDGGYADAELYWKIAASKSGGTKKGAAYTAPLALFNEAAALEECGKMADAAALYSQAANASDFMLKSTALFNLGRVQEELGEWDKARDAYSELAVMRDSWANLAKSRLIALDAAGK